MSCMMKCMNDEYGVPNLRESSRSTLWSISMGCYSHCTTPNLGDSLEKGSYVKFLNVSMFFRIFDVECGLVTHVE